ncbi:MAG: hypothetical protein IT223_06750 [Crocinitomicaceae bacterium]|nr:hypothetical protein [Crocinitomicaceae bacterium]
MSELTTIVVGRCIVTAITSPIKPIAENLKKILLLLFSLLLLVGAVSGQHYIYVSEEGVRRFLRVDIGYTQWTHQQQDSAVRMARGIHLLNEVKIISGFWNTDWAVTVHDAFYLSLDMGLLANKQHITGSGAEAEKESKFSTSVNMGYLAMAGYREKKWAALAGIDFRWRSSRVGELTMPNLNGPLLNFSMPLVGRLEYGMSKSNPDFRVMLTGWSTLGASDTRPLYQSLRLEFPLSLEGRTWLCAMFTKQEALSEDVFYFTAPSPTVFNQWMIGIRIGNLP